MAQLDLFQNEVLEECLRERSTTFFLQKKRHDFWITIQPQFIEKKEISLKIKETNFYKQKKNLISPTNILSSNSSFEFYAAIVSPNLNFIQWLSLRLGYFENLNSFEINKKLAVNPDYISNGIFGKFNFDSKEKYNEEASVFNSNSKFLHPSIYINRQKKILESYYSNIK
jgi:hypothetical protein